MEQTPRDVHALIESGTVVKPEKLLTIDDKEALAEAGTEFTVTSISMGDDADYGPFWEVKAVLNGDPISFRMSQHIRRDPFVSALAQAAPSGPIGGLRLVAYPGRGANSFIQIEPA